MAAKIPDRIGNYQIVREIGRGGMGVVYLATDPAISRRVALKMLPAELAADETTRKRFLREIGFLSTLEHPHIVPTYGVEISDEQPFLVMRYLPGRTLRERLAEKNLSRAGLWQMLRQIAQALDYAHSKQLVHRDVKPTNILFDDSDNAYISDFGIAKAVNDNTRLTLMTTLTGTPEYMSPEQFQSHTVDGRADQYSLAIILYEALAERLPFQGDTFQLMYQHVYQKPTALSAITQEVTPELAAVVERALAKNPADRFESVAAFVAAAEGAAQQPNLRIAPAPVITRPQDATTAKPAPPPEPEATAKPAIAPRPAAAAMPPVEPAVAAEPVATGKPVVAATPGAVTPAVDDFQSKAPARIVTGAGGQVKPSGNRRRKQVAAARGEDKPATRQPSRPRVPGWAWLAAAIMVLGLLFIFTRIRGEGASATADGPPTIDPTLAAALPTAEPVAAAEIPEEDDIEIVRIVENGAETDKGWLLPDDGTPVVVATGVGPMQLRFSGGGDLYLAPDIEALLARYEEGYRVQFDSGEIVFHAATDAPVYLGNRLGSWVLVGEPGALAGVVSQVGQFLEFTAHCFAGNCELKGDLHDTPIRLMAGEAGRVGGSGVPEMMGPADYGRFAALADVVPTPTVAPSPTATTPPTATREPTPTTRPPATSRPKITLPTLTPVRPPATIALPTSTVELPPISNPTSAPPEPVEPSPTVAVPPTPDSPTPTAAVPPTAALPP